MTKNTKTKATPEMKFGAALKQARTEADLSQGDVAAWLRENHTRVLQQSALSQYEYGNITPDLFPRDVAALEAAVGKPAGYLSWHLGWVPSSLVDGPPTVCDDVMQAIASDRRLSSEGRRALRVVAGALIAQ